MSEGAAKIDTEIEGMKILSSLLEIQNRMRFCVTLRWIALFSDTDAEYYSFTAFQKPWNPNYPIQSGTYYLTLSKASWTSLII